VQYNSRKDASIMNIAQLAANYPNLIEWLEPYVVGRFSGILAESAVELHGGFHAPEREAEGIWRTQVGQELEEDPHVASAQCEWWQEGEVVLGIGQASDPVMGMDHFTWYRVPAGDLRRKGAIDQVKTYDASFTNDLLIRHANADSQHTRKAYENLLHYLDLLEAGLFTAPYLVRVLQHGITCAKVLIEHMNRFDEEYTRPDRVKVEVYEWAVPMIEQAFCATPEPEQAIEQKEEGEGQESYETYLGTVSLHYNNACTHSVCPFCRSYFKPGYGRWAFLGGLPGRPLCLDCWQKGTGLLPALAPGANEVVEKVDIRWLIEHDQDLYHATRTYLRGAIPQGVTVVQAAIWMMQQRGEDYFQRDLHVNWIELAHQCIDDTQELMEHEAAHGLPTEP
jgi:hypothetical protein